MLGDLDAPGGGDQGRRGGDVEALRPVPAGADDLYNIHAGVHFRGVVPHGGGAAGDLVDRLGLGALGGEGRQKGRVLGGGGLAAHDLVHDGVGLVVGQVLFAHDLYNGFFDHACAPSLLSAIKFFSISLPLGVRMDSGWNWTP